MASKKKSGRKVDESEVIEPKHDELTEPKHDELTEPKHDELTEPMPGLEEALESQPDLSEKKVERFYDKLRTKIVDYVERKGAKLGKTREFLLLVPDVFILLFRLFRDDRVSGKNKALLGTGLAYFIFPLDVIPEGIVGPIGYLDDLVFAVYILNRVLLDTDEEVVREHWSGQDDVLAMIRKVLGAAGQFVSRQFLDRIKRLLR
jgi:uncharacterized membrane protein YkvA (DUF1232 family)